jgi:hypothetical protein
LNVEALGLPLGPRQLLQVGRWVVRLSPILCIAILLIVSLLVVRSWKGFLRWWGYPLLTAGVAVLLTAIVLWVGLDVLVSLGRENLPASVSIDVYDTISGILVYILHRYSLVTGAEGIILGLIGLGLVIGSFFVGRSSRPARALTPPPAAPPSPSPSPVWVSNSACRFPLRSSIRPADDVCLQTSGRPIIFQGVNSSR